MSEKTGEIEKIGEVADKNRAVRMQIAVKDLKASPLNPRTHFDEEKIKSLAESLRLQGQLQPIVARKIGANGQYEIVIGECRWRAAKIAGLVALDANVREMDDVAVLEAQRAHEKKAKKKK